MRNATGVTRSRRLVLLGLMAVVAIEGCGGGGSPPVADRTTVVSDGANGGVDGFYFLPPLVPEPAFSWTFQPGLEADLRVDIVLLAGGEPSGDPVAQLPDPAGASTSETIRCDQAAELYVVNFHTDEYADSLQGAGTYRIYVRRASDDAEYGYADVQLFANMSEARSLTDDTVFALKDGRTLPIKFRIEEGTEPVPARSEQLAFTSARGGIPEIYLMSPDGTGLVRLTDDGAWKEMVDWSPDGTELAFHYRPASAGGIGEIGVVNTDGTGLRNLTNHPAWDREPTWSPDGSKIAFSSDRSGTDDIYVMDADSGEILGHLTQGGRRSLTPDWSPDGSRIAFTAVAGSYPYHGDICIMDATTGTLIRQVTGDGDDFNSDWSPDGRELAYVQGSNIHIVGVDGSNDVQITHYTGSTVAHVPRWSPSGDRIAFRLRTDPAPFPAHWDICVINRDGSGFAQLTDYHEWTSGPSWWGP